MATLFQVLQFFDINGNPLAWGEIYWFEATTSTHKDTWTTQDESTPQSHPIVLDGEGRVPTSQGSGMWLKGSYKLVIKDSLGATITTLDDINEYDSLDWTGLTASIADLNSTETTALIKSADYTITAADRNKTILVNAAGGTIDVDLPEASAVGNKFIVTIKKIDKESTDVFIIPASPESIDEVRPSYVLYDYNDFITVHSDGSNWKIIAYNRRNTTLTFSTTPVSPDLFSHDSVFEVNATSGEKIVDLPDLSVVGKGYKITIKKSDSSVNAVKIKAVASQFIDGKTELDITTQYVSYTFIAINNINNWAIIEEVAGIHSISKAWQEKYIEGLNLSPNAIDPNFEIDMAKGKARDFLNTTNMELANVFSKKINANWALGSGNGGFPPTKTLLEETWYYVFLLSKDDGNAVEMGFDDQLDASALIVATTAAGYIRYRRIGSVYTKKTTKYITSFTSSLFNEGSVRLVMWDYLQVATDAATSNIFSYATDVVDGTQDGVEKNVIVAVPPAPLRVKCLITTHLLFNAGGSGDAWIYYYSKNQIKPPNITVQKLLATTYVSTPAGTQNGYSRFELISDGQEIKYVGQQAGISYKVFSTMIGYYENVGQE